LHISYALTIFYKLLVIAKDGDGGDYMGSTAILHKLNMSLAHQLPDIVLENSAIFNRMAHESIMIFISRIWIIPPKKQWLYGI
jgi:hypothetical protein